MNPSEPTAIESWLREAAFVRALARDLVSTTTDADDLVQETWLRARNTPPRAGFAWRAWLAGLVRNVARERRRAELRRTHHEAAAAAAEAAVGAIAGVARDDRAPALPRRQDARGDRAATWRTLGDDAQPVEAGARADAPAARSRRDERKDGLARGVPAVGGRAAVRAGSAGGQRRGRGEARRGRGRPARRRRSDLVVERRRQWQSGGGRGSRRGPRGCGDRRAHRAADCRHGRDRHTGRTPSGRPLGRGARRRCRIAAGRNGRHREVARRWSP
ncbi:MAG: hypothetical protein EXS13_06100 [Planctomycetes bacterium]|nr:hypothetical protein [Planctomycetota bacterium]